MSERKIFFTIIQAFPSHELLVSLHFFLLFIEQVSLHSFLHSSSASLSSVFRYPVDCSNPQTAPTT